jgi:pyruvate/2-oxoglutarate dehydrogenase complex dihydrolipoamide acyltransferase (E2) component
MATELVMPKLSDTMKEGSIVQWLKAEGDPVEAGEVIAEIQSDKATIEFEAYADGVLSRIYVQADQTVPVGEKIGLITDEGEEATAAPAAEPVGTRTEAPPAEEAEVAAEPAAQVEEPAPEPVAEQPALAVPKRKPVKRAKAVEGLARVKFGGRGFEMGLSEDAAKRVIAAAQQAAGDSEQA